MNLTTYAALDAHRERWSDDLRRARLVFADEAHHALTSGRRRALGPTGCRRSWARDTRYGLVQQLVIHAPLGMPTLNPTALHEVREVLTSCPTFDPQALPGRQAFDAMFFQHPKFSGTGKMLQNWLRVRRTAGAYEARLARLFPEKIADRLLGESSRVGEPHRVPWDEDSARESLRFGSIEPEPSVEERLASGAAARFALRILQEQSPRRQRILRAWCGFDGPEATRSELADQENVSTSRIGRSSATPCTNCVAASSIPS